MTTSSPSPITTITPEQCSRLRYFFCDIDDTMTTDGILPPTSYEALWELAGGGMKVVPVTGRPAGWCDMIARFWPVEGVVGENGAFYFAYERHEKRMIRRELQPAEERKTRSELLHRAAERVLKEVPGSAMAADQPYRLTDVAIDFCEDVPPLPEESVSRICEIFEEEGLTCKVSSIHVNAWYGSYDKVTCVDQLLRDRAGSGLAELGEAVAFIGDSPNDEPLFANLPVSIGVANVRRFLDRMESGPRYVTEQDGADGFVEAARIILPRREYD
jgi:hypothetical protein